MSEKNDALRLADMLERMPLGECDHQAAAKLRQLHEENAELRKANDAFGQRQKWWNERMVALEAQRDALLAALKGVLLRDERNTCRHEETHRGGAIWEICDSCGAMWADDQGGKPKWENPKEWTQARAAIKAVEEGK